MEKVWVAWIDDASGIELFPTAEKAYEYLLDRLSDNSLTEDPDESKYWEDLAKNLTTGYDRNNEDFGCDYCWARAEEVF